MKATGVRTFMEGLKQTGQTKDNLEAMHKIRTRAHLAVKYVAKAIPCSCLDEQKKQAEEDHKVGKCYCCHKVIRRKHK
jgi:hypothetical protein